MGVGVGVGGGGLKGKCWVCLVFLWGLEVLDEVDEGVVYG